MNIPRYASSMACVAMLLSGVTTSALAVVYKVDTLEPVSGGTELTTPTDINAAGAVAGRSEYGEEVFVRSVYWNAAGQLTDLTPGDNRTSNMAGISDAGTVIYSETDRFYGWNAGAVTDLGIGFPTAVNGKGQLVGTFAGVFGIWTNGVVTQLPTLPGTNSYANDINNNAIAVGSAYSPNTRVYRAVIWQNGTVRDIGTLPGDTGSVAYAINDLNQVVGYSVSSTGKQRAFIWENGVMRDLGFPADALSYAYGINNSGQIVGGFFIPNTAYGRAFVWQSGVIRDLSLELGAGNCGAYDINSVGQMTAACTNPNYSFFRPFRLTPIAMAADLSATLTATPLPAIVGLPLTYTATVKNIGSITAINATLTQTLPATGFSNISLLTNKGSCSGNTLLTCTFGDLAAGESATVTITATPLSTGSNTAYYDSSIAATTTTTDVNPDNNAAKISFTVFENNAAVSVHSINSQTTATRGGNITYTWDLSNGGPLTARNVTFTDTLPNGLSLVSVKTTAGTCSGTQTVICNIDILRSSDRITIVAKANVRGTMINKATITSTTPDSYLGDNSATVTTRVK